MSNNLNPSAAIDNNADERRREARARRSLKREGSILKKSRSRTPEHYHFGQYWILDCIGNLEAGHPDWGMSLEDVEAALRE